MPFSRLLFLATLVAAGLLLFRDLGLDGIAVDEATSTVVEVEMMRDGHWFFLTSHGEPDARKPPLAMWMSAASIAVLGEHEVALRFPGALLGLGTIMLVFVWAGRLGGSIAAMTAALALVTVPTFLFDHCARTNVQDSPLLFFTTAAALTYVYGPPTLVGGAIAGLFAGLALLSKGVAAFAILAAVAAYELVTSRGRGVFRRRPWVFAIVAFGVAAVWFVPEWWAAQSHVQNEISRDLVGRVFHGGLFRRFDFHLLKLWENLGLWLLAVPFGLLALVRRGDSRGWLAALSAAIPLFIFTAASAKYPWYALPAYPAIAVLIGVGAAALCEALSPGSRRFVAAATLAAIATSFVPAYAQAWARAGEIVWDHSKLRGFERWASATLPPEVPVVVYADGINHTFAGNETFYAWKLRRRLQFVDTADALCRALDGARSGAFAIVSEPLLPQAPCLAEFSHSLRMTRLWHGNPQYVPKRIIPVRAPIPPFFVPSEVALDPADGHGFLSGWSSALDPDGKRRRMTRASAFVTIDLPDADHAALSLRGEWKVDDGCELELVWNGHPAGKLPRSGPEAVLAIDAGHLLTQNLLEVVRPCGTDDARSSLVIERIMVRPGSARGSPPPDAHSLYRHFTVGPRHGGREISDGDAPDGRAVAYGVRPNDTPAYLFFVPLRLPAGHYQVDFWLRGHGVDQGKPAAVLDVWADRGRRRFARRELRLGEITTLGGYRRVELDFVLDSETIVQPRVEAAGGGAEVRVGGVTVRSGRSPGGERAMRLTP